MMPCLSDSSEAVSYRMAFVLPATGRILGERCDAGYTLPRIEVPRWKRPAMELQRSMRETWGLSGIILDILSMSETSPSFAIVEIFSFHVCRELVPVDIEDVDPSSMSHVQKRKLMDILRGTLAEDPFDRLGWIDEAVEWVESATGRQITSKADIEQLNAGGRFSLLRFHTTNDWDYWLKATGEPNIHELSITKCLSRLCGDYLPELVAVRPEWNAWLASGEGQTAPQLPTDPSALFGFLEDAVESMAELQLRTVGHSFELLEAGAYDQSLEMMLKESGPLFDYLEECMSLQTSAKVQPIGRSRLHELRQIFDDVCHRVEDLGIPETVIHGDLNRANIVSRGDHCQFIDWCEGYVGNPLVCLQHLLLLNQMPASDLSVFMNSILMERYKSVLADACDPSVFAKGFVYMPILGVASALYGRGDWLQSPERCDRRRQAYSRAMARHMDRAAQESALLEAL